MSGSLIGPGRWWSWQGQAQVLGHNYIGTEHILLGLIEEEGVAAQVLRDLGVDPDSVRREVIGIVGEGSGTQSGYIRFDSPRTLTLTDFPISPIGSRSALWGVVSIGLM